MITAALPTHNTDVGLSFASPELQFELYFPYQPGLTVAALLSLAQLSVRWPTVQWADYALGIWGKPVSASALLQPGDRVELYQPLIIDPKAARRLRGKRKR